MSRRFCLTLDLKDDPALIAEYRKYHEKIWPEVTQSLKDCFPASGPLNSTPNPVVTSMAGFESSGLLFLLLGRFSRLRLSFSVGSSAIEPVITCMAGFCRVGDHLHGRFWLPLSGPSARPPHRDASCF
jgi:L-rhamnose mutarotase